MPEIGPKSLAPLLNHFDDLSNAWSASEAQLRSAGLRQQAVNNLLQVRTEIDLDAEMAKIKQQGAWFLTIADRQYPDLLRTLPDAPTVLYGRGILTTDDRLALSMVGTRKATAYGREAATDFARQLAGNGITIVSGLAQGIDSAAHRGALDGGGRTIAVLGCGIDVMYPRDNRELALEIVQNGAIITEFPIGTKPIAHNFPQRNRIIAGLSLGVLVVEAPQNSGALITAELALEYGREVFAVPGNIYNPMGKGTNLLIQDGAKMVIGVQDILDELNIAYEHVQTRTVAEMLAPTTDVEVQLLEQVGTDPIHVDDLARTCDLPVQIVTSTLTILELKGLVQSVGQMQYSRKQPH